MTHNSQLKTEHPKILRLVGYCYETQNKHVEMKGGQVFAKIVEQLLYFEYMECGSLAKHI
jgi:hypothetical protein